LKLIWDNRIHKKVNFFYWGLLPSDNFKFFEVFLFCFVLFFLNQVIRILAALLLLVAAGGAQKFSVPWCLCFLWNDL